VLLVLFAIGGAAWAIGYQLKPRANRTVHGELWEFVSEVPWIGANITAIQDTTEAAEVLVTDALPAAVTVLSTLRLDQIKLEGGGVKLHPFRDAQFSLPVLSDAFARAQSIVSGIDRSGRLPVIDDSLSEILDIIETATPTIVTVERILPTLLQLAGSEGPRNYLLIFQNNAKIRATGGNPAASAVIRVDNGSISLDEQADSSTFYEAGTVGRGYVELPAETLAQYETDFVRYSQNYTRTPNYRQRPRCSGLCGRRRPASRSMAQSRWTLSSSHTC
jgi:hypothetical protein